MRLWLLILFLIVAASCGNDLNAQSELVSERAIEAVNSYYGWDYVLSIEHIDPGGSVEDYIILNDTFEIEDDEMFYPRRSNPVYREFYRVLVSREDGLYEVWINSQGMAIQIKVLEENEYKSY